MKKRFKSGIASNSWISWLNPFLRGWTIGV